MDESGIIAEFEEDVVDKLEKGELRRDNVDLDNELKEKKQSVPKSINGWTKNARNLVKLWTTFMAVTRGRYHRESIQKSNLSVRLKIISAIFGSLAALIAFLNTTFTQYAIAVIILSVFAGIFSSVSTTLVVVMSILKLDEEAERYRQTAVQYSHISNDMQSILVEEDESLLPKATDVLKKMSDVSHVLQLFAPPLDADGVDTSDLPSMILVKATGNKKDKKSIVNMSSSEHNEVGSQYEHIFDRDSDDNDKKEKTAEDRKKERLRKIREIIKEEEDMKKEQERLRKEQEELDELKSLLTQGNLGSTSPLLPRKNVNSVPPYLNVQHATATDGSKHMDRVHSVPNIANMMNVSSGNGSPNLPKSHNNKPEVEDDTDSSIEGKQPKNVKLQPQPNVQKPLVPTKAALLEVIQRREEQLKKQISDVGRKTRKHFENNAERLEDLQDRILDPGILPLTDRKPKPGDPDRSQIERSNKRQSVTMKETSLRNSSGSGSKTPIDGRRSSVPKINPSPPRSETPPKSPSEVRKGDSPRSNHNVLGRIVKVLSPNKSNQDDDLRRPESMSSEQRILESERKKCDTIIEMANIDLDESM